MWPVVLNSCRSFDGVVDMFRIFCVPEQTTFISCSSFEVKLSILSCCVSYVLHSPTVSRCFSFDKYFYRFSVNGSSPSPTSSSYSLFKFRFLKIHAHYQCVSSDVFGMLKTFLMRHFLLYTSN